LETENRLIDSRTKTFVPSSKCHALSRSAWTFQLILAGTGEWLEKETMTINFIRQLPVTTFCVNHVTINQHLFRPPIAPLPLIAGLHTNRVIIVRLGQSY
jgi:hypothetical protein